MVRQKKEGLFCKTEYCIKNQLNLNKICKNIDKLKHNIVIIQILKYGKTQKQGTGFLIILLAFNQSLLECSQRH